jgi:hypothetical protein
MGNSSSLGGISPEEVREFAADFEAPPTEAGASLTSRFSRHVSNLIVARIPKGETGQFSIFLRSEALLEDAQRWKSVENPLLAHAEDPVSGRIWLSTASLGSAFELLLEWQDVASLFKAVRQAGFGSVPALVVDWRGNQPTGRLYRSGLNDAEDCEAVFFEEAPISVTQLKEVLDSFYEKSLRTPALVVEGHANRVWKDPSKGIPEHRPEEVIQGRLLDVLKATFSRHGLRAEPVTEDGRAISSCTRRPCRKRAGLRPLQSGCWSSRHFAT